MGARIGLNCKMYRNTGSYASPSWQEIKNVRDVSTGATKGEADASTRGTGAFEARVGVLKDLDITFEMIDDTADTGGHIAAFEDSYINGTALDLAIMNGDITTSGSKGWRARFEVFQFDEQQPLKDVAKISVGIKITYDATNPPARLSI